MNKKNKIVGYSFLDAHSGMQAQKDLDTDHVIVDRNDWEAVVNFFHRHPDFVEELITPQATLFSIKTNESCDFKTTTPSTSLYVRNSGELGMLFSAQSVVNPLGRVAFGEPLPPAIKPINPEEGD